MSTSMAKLGWNQGLVMGPVVNVADPLLCAPRSRLCPSLCCSVCLLMNDSAGGCCMVGVGP